MTGVSDCDICGREMAKAQRVSGGERYCGTCYKRLFRRRLCPRCGNLAWLPRFNLNAICHTCETQTPCVRCGKTEFVVGKLTAYGAVCSSCSPYFREQRPCAHCGTLSGRLTRVQRQGIAVPVCPTCATRHRKTCSSCRRHRELYPAPDGRSLCRACSEQDDRPCTACRQPMAAGRGKLCETCTWVNTFSGRLKIDQAMFSGDLMRDIFSRFSAWLLLEVGAHKAALTLHNYLHFFIEVERKWNRLPDYDHLVAHFGAEGLRRVRLPMRWLIETQGIAVDVTKREADSERRQIAVMLNRFPEETTAAKVLKAFSAELLARQEAGKLTIRTVRATLSPAAALLARADPAGTLLPDQAAVTGQLLESPGQKAGLSVFLHHLSKHHALTLVALTDSQRTKSVRRGKLEAEFLSFLRSTPQEHPIHQWWSLALAYFHGLPRTVGRKLKADQVSVHQDGSCAVNWQGQSYWLPAPVTVAQDHVAIGPVQ